MGFFQLLIFFVTHTCGFSSTCFSKRYIIIVYRLTLFPDCFLSFCFWWLHNQFSKASGRIKEAILQLPLATEEEDIEESAALTETEKLDADNQSKEEMPSASFENSKKEEFDPFGLDALILNKNDEKAKGKKDGAAKYRKGEDDENKRFLKCQREALVLCLEIAAKRYKLPW